MPFKRKAAKLSTGPLSTKNFDMSMTTMLSFLSGLPLKKKKGLASSEELQRTTVQSLTSYA